MTLETAALGHLSHLARCTSCGFAVRFQPTTNGNGFSLLTDDPDLALGIGPSMLPICRTPHHGEMTLADDEQPEQPSLPGITPPFNYEGAYLELEAKAVEVERLAAIHAEDAARAKGSRKNWESAASVFSTMALEFRRRRRAKADTHDAATDEPVSETVK